MKKFFTERKINIILSVCAVAAMWIAWIIIYYATDNGYIVPSFADSMKSVGKCFASAVFWRAFANTFLRSALAFIVSFVFAAALAALGVAFPKFAAFLNPVMIFFRTLPTLAVVLILLVWTTPVVAPVIVTALVLFPMNYSQFLAAAGAVDGTLREALNIYSVPVKEKIFKVYLPMVSPAVFAQVGANLSLGIKITVSAEVLASTYRSLGGLMQEARLFLEMPRLAALTLLTVAAGLIVETAFSQLARINRKWLKGAEK